MYPTVIFQCAHKKAMREAFHQSPLGVTTVNQINYDLILDIRYIRNLLRLTIQTSCNQTPAMETRHPIQTPVLSAAFITDPTFNNYISAVDSTPMSHVITVLHTVLTGDIRTTIQDFEYSQPIREKLRKDNSWTDGQKNMVDWVSFYNAMRKIPRSHRISIMKLSHQLWNTNVQNNKYYNQISSCPMCGLSSKQPPILLNALIQQLQLIYKVSLLRYKAALHLSSWKPSYLGYDNGKAPTVRLRSSPQRQVRVSLPYKQSHSPSTSRPPSAGIPFIAAMSPAHGVRNSPSIPAQRNH
jgi:hypothetical protein